MKRFVTMLSTAAILVALVIGAIMPTIAVAKPLKTKDFPIGVTEKLPDRLIDDLPDGATVDYVYAGNVNTGRGILAVDIGLSASIDANEVYDRILKEDDAVTKKIDTDAGLDDHIDAGVFYAHPYPDSEDTVGYVVLQDNHVLFIVEVGWEMIEEGANVDMLAKYAVSVMKDGLEKTPLPKEPGWKMLETSYSDRENEGWS